jgi:hypothetical protein
MRAIVICILFSLLAVLAAPARAVLPDEIQVYTDDINAPGEFGVELHVNTTPKGRRTPEFANEVAPHHGLRVTPELSWGLTRTLAAGLYFPTTRDAEWLFAANPVLDWPLDGPERATSVRARCTSPWNGKTARCRSTSASAAASATPPTNGP